MESKRALFVAHVFMVDLAEWSYMETIHGTDISTYMDGSFLW